MLGVFRGRDDERTSRPLETKGCSWLSRGARKPQFCLHGFTYNLWFVMGDDYGKVTAFVWSE